MVNLDDSVGEIVEKKATEQRRSASSYVALLIEADLRASGLLSPAQPTFELQEFIAKLQAAAAASPRIVARLEAALRRELRPKKSAA